MDISFIIFETFQHVINIFYCQYISAGTGFSGGYHEYFGLNTDTESLTYLTTANYMLHKFYPFMITIAEVGALSFVT